MLRNDDFQIHSNVFSSLFKVQCNRIGMTNKEWGKYVDISGTSWTGTRLSQMTMKSLNQKNPPETEPCREIRCLNIESFQSFLSAASALKIVNCICNQDHLHVKPPSSTEESWSSQVAITGILFWIIKVLLVNCRTLVLLLVVLVVLLVTWNNKLWLSPNTRVLLFYVLTAWTRAMARSPELTGGWDSEEPLC